MKNPSPSSNKIRSLIQSNKINNQTGLNQDLCAEELLPAKIYCM